MQTAAEATLFYFLKSDESEISAAHRLRLLVTKMKVMEIRTRTLTVPGFGEIIAAFQIRRLRKAC